MKSVKFKLGEAPWSEVFEKVDNKVERKSWRQADDLISDVDILVYWQLRDQVQKQVKEKLR
jgi:hypothetical protein